MDNNDALALENQLCFALYRANNSLIRAYKPYLSKLDLTYPQYVVMMCLWEKDQIPIKQLSIKAAMEPAQLSPLLQRLESKSYIQRKKDLQDERSIIVALSSSGQALRAVACQVPMKMRSCLTLKDDELLALKNLAERVWESLEEL